MDNFDAGISYTLFFVLILFLSIIFGAFKEMEKNKKKIYIFITFFIFFIIMAFRKWDMGSDTLSYIYMFDYISNITSPLSEYLDKTNIESGYVIYNWLLGKVTEDARLLFVISSAFVNFSIAKFVYKYVDNPGMFCCFFVGFTQLDFFLSAMRHSIAIAILLFAFNDVMNKKKIRSLLLFLLATTFHNASWIFLIVYLFIGNKENESQIKSRFTLYYVLFVVIFICSFFFDNILSTLLDIFPKYNYYNNSEMFDGEPRLAIVLKIIVYSIILMAPKFFISEKNSQLTLRNEGEKLSVINIALIIIAHNATALTRLSSSFILFATMHYSNYISILQRKHKIILTLISIVCIFAYGLVLIVLKTPEWQTTYPIKIGFDLQ